MNLFWCKAAQAVYGMINFGIKGHTSPSPKTDFQAWLKQVRQSNLRPLHHHLTPFPFPFLSLPPLPFPQSLYFSFPSFPGHEVVF